MEGQRGQHKGGKNLPYSSMTGSAERVITRSGSADRKTVAKPAGVMQNICSAVYS